MKGSRGIAESAEILQRIYMYTLLKRCVFCVFA
jgi:hypothetical protein